MPARIGVYLCECGSNVAEGIDLERLAAFAAGLEDVVAVVRHPLLCGEAACAMLADEIRARGLDRLVVAACSPKEHEPTFRRVCVAGGLNPHMLQLANIRELAGWVTPDKARATAKAETYVRAAVRRVRRHEPLETREIDIVTDALVIGAGVAGIEAALTLAQKGRTAFVVEREPYVGGKVMKCDEVFPNLECASCMLEPKLDAVLHDERIRVLTNAEVESVRGDYGNFLVKVRRKARYVNMQNCIGCGACYPACPVEVASEFDEGLGRRKAIYVPFRGSLPNVPIIDREHCLHFTDAGCTACRDGCPLGGGAEFIDFDEQDELLELKVGAIIVATGFEPYSGAALRRLGFGRYPDVYTTVQLERLLNPGGPSGGKVVKRDGRPPRSVCLVPCVGREPGELGYCSAVCCQNSLKLAHLLQQRAPELEVSLVHADWCLPGKRAQRIYDAAARERLRMIRVADPAALQVSDAPGTLLVEGLDPAGRPRQIEADMVVLAVGMRPSAGSAELAARLRAPLDEDGFFREEHASTGPVSSALQGVYLAGCASGPRDIAAAVAGGAGAAGKVLSGLLPGQKLRLESAVSVIDPDRCGGCRTCLGQCPYQAISFDAERGVCVVSDVLCKGCGTCDASCPAGAATARHFTTAQLVAELLGVLE
ncbi:MAG: CoB--CoM heterodisulfide reductase iron-sulfur subunit A family protein [Deltaproteobacteria bacterium]|nr:CoB--CoM heterodisulfide reductase iron-sulfur subunit A family protein [Deltaproteobacteria bacterium]